VARLGGTLVAVLGLALAGCGSDGASTTAAKPAATTTSTAGAPRTGPRLRGADYALDLQPGWSDTTLKRKRAAAVDRVISSRVPPAVAEVALLGAPAGRVSTAQRLQAQARREIAGVDATAVTRKRPLTLDGARAITYQYRSTSPAGARIQSRQVLAIHGGRMHVITLIAARTQFAAADTALGTMLSSWRWTASG
jgi:type IV pilus biogenesis protein CpaD/CtpE